MCMKLTRVYAYMYIIIVYLAGVGSVTWFFSSFELYMKCKAHTSNSNQSWEYAIVRHFWTLNLAWISKFL